MKLQLNQFLLAFLIGICFLTLPLISKADEEMARAMCIDASESYASVAVEEGYNLTKILATYREGSPERSRALDIYQRLVKEKISGFKEASYEDRRSSNDLKRSWAHTKVLVYVLAVTYAMSRPVLGEFFTVKEAADYLYYECLKGSGY
jgi:hypothetical protein